MDFFPQRFSGKMFLGGKLLCSREQCSPASLATALSNSQSYQHLHSADCLVYLVDWQSDHMTVGSANSEQLKRH